MSQKGSVELRTGPIKLMKVLDSDLLTSGLTDTLTMTYVGKCRPRYLLNANASHPPHSHCRN
jgi:hypothetical protein